MSSEIIVSGVTFPNYIVKALPTIPSLSTLRFFGSGFDGVNGNRVPGGPTLVNVMNGPIVSSAYSTFGAVNVQAMATATETSGSVSSLTVTNGGTGYVLSPGVINVTGGSGTGASVTGATLSGGAITGFTGLVGGSGFVSNPGVTINGGNYATQNTQNPRTTAVLASGWTWFAVARSTAISGVQGMIFDDRVTTGGSIGFQGIFSYLVVSSNPTLRYAMGTSNADVTLSSAVSNWRCVACTYSGGSIGTMTTYDLTDNVSNAVSSPSGVGANNNSPQFGAGNYSGVNPITVDIAMGMVALTPLSSGTLTSIYASVKSLMARRGIVC
jgi:hypothetical protein